MRRDVICELGQMWSDWNMTHSNIISIPKIYTLELDIHFVINNVVVRFKDD